MSVDFPEVCAELAKEESEMPFHCSAMNPAIFPKPAGITTMMRCWWIASQVRLTIVDLFSFLILGVSTIPEVDAWCVTWRQRLETGG